MTTFGQIVYMVLDMLKELHDDSYYTEEHIIFLSSKIRALLLERKYKNSRNMTFQSVSGENYQQICIDLEPAELIPDGCSGKWLRSVQEIPSTLNISEPKLYLVGDMIQSVVTFIPIERMPYVGHNKWLKNIVYASKSQDDHLYISGRNPQFLYLTQAKMEAVFADPEMAASLSCDGSTDGCNILDMEFPLEDSLIASCVEMVVQELMGSRYAPEDRQNNAKDDLGTVGIAPSRHPRPAENSTYKNREETE